MSATTTTEVKALNYRRYKDGETKGPALRDHIFQSSYTYKCPTYIQATPPCRAAALARRSSLNIGWALIGVTRLKDMIT